MKTTRVRNGRGPGLRRWALVVFAMAAGPARPIAAPGQEAPMPIHEDFDKDPGWEGVNNLVAATDGPTIAQDFGYRPIGGAGSRTGEIGGTIWNSTTPASYGMKIGPFSYADRLSASGRIRIRRVSGRGDLYLGFFNSTRQGWRPWSALMIQFSGAHRGEGVRGRPDAGAQVWLSALSATWQADSTVTDVLIPADNSEHVWSLQYNPDAGIDRTWPHRDLARVFESGRLSEQSAFDRARQSEPDLARGEFRRRLERAADQGLLVFDPRRGTDYWETQPDAEKFAGCVTLQIDGGNPRRMYLAPGHREEPMMLDRFGVVNQQTNGRDMEFALSDLQVNGHKINLAQDPGWEGRGNHLSYRERDFHSRQDFGFRETNWAGEAPGEIGGVFWRTEPVDPLHGYYAADIGTLSLDDPIAFSGTIAFVEGQPDSGVAFGYFNPREIMAEITDEKAGSPVPSTLGILIEGPTRVGYYFSGFCCTTRKHKVRQQGPLFLPTRQRHRFSFAYDPTANHGGGGVTVTLDDKSTRFNLKPQQRANGAHFERFGIWNVRSGGKFVEVYLDDLTYTSRRPANATRHTAKVVTVPYPEGGRKY